MLFKRKIAAPAEPDPHADLKVDTANYLQKLAAGYYDFVDLGTLDGGGFKIGELQGGQRGLGFELSADAVRRAKDKGWDVALQDVCRLEPTSPQVDFAVCSHVLEHLPDLQSIQHVLRSLSSLCRNYILISGPCFETEPYLEQLGLKVLHSLMLDHTCKIKVGELVTILHKLELRDFTIALGERMIDSSDRWIYSSKQSVPPEGLWTFDSAKHLPKNSVGFDREVFRDFVCVVKLDQAVDTDMVLKRFFWGYDKIVDRSSWKF